MNERAPLSVPEPVSTLLLKLYDRWLPQPFEPTIVRELRCNHEAVSDRALLRQEGETLTFHMQGVWSRRGFPSLDMDARVSGTLENGATFQAHELTLINRGPEASLSFNQWSIVEGMEPLLWLGRVEGLGKTLCSGNLNIERIDADGLHHGGRKHFRLFGAHYYYLFQRGDFRSPEWFLIVETKGGPPDADALAGDLLILQFALGRELRIPAILGLSPDFQTIASVNGFTRPWSSIAGRPVMPFDRDNDGRVHDCWLSVLFEKLSTAMRRDADPRKYWLAMESILQANSGHVDLDFLRLSVALEAFSYHLLVESDRRAPIVKNKRDWKEWVKQQEDTIRKHAAQGFADSLFNKAMMLHRPASGDVVNRAFDTIGLTITPEMQTELDRRNNVVHTGLMAPDGYDADENLRSIALVRTMLVAIVARSAGYAGAINGWDWGSRGAKQPEKSWWAVNDADRSVACTRYRVHGEYLPPSPAGEPTE